MASKPEFINYCPGRGCSGRDIVLQNAPYAFLSLYAGLIAIQHGIFEIMPGSWLLGHFFSAAMLSVSGLRFLVFDIGGGFRVRVTHIPQRKIRNERDF